MNNFNITGAQQEVKTNASLAYTGLGPIRVLAVNPTLSQLNELLDRESPEGLDPMSSMCDYSIKDNPNSEKKERPVVFWVETIETGNKFPVTFNIGLDVETFSTGSIRILNGKLQDTISKSIETVTSNPKMSWFSQRSIHAANVGEYVLYNFMSKLVRFKPEVEGADWYNSMKDNKCLITDIYEGNYEGLRSFVEYANNNGNIINVLHIVKEVEKEDGSVKLRQEILRNPNFMFKTENGEVTDWIINRCVALRNEATVQGRDITTRYYTWTFQEFNKDNVENPDNVPNETATPSSNLDWLS